MGGPTPGAPYAPQQNSFEEWVVARSIPKNQSGPHDDPDADGNANLLEYVFGLAPLIPDPLPLPTIQRLINDFEISFPLASGLKHLTLTIEQSSSLSPGDWQTVPGFLIEPEDALQHLMVSVPSDKPQMFFRLKVELDN